MWSKKNVTGRIWMGLAILFVLFAWGILGWVGLFSIIMGLWKGAHL